MPARWRNAFAMVLWIESSEDALAELTQVKARFFALLFEERGKVREREIERMGEKWQNEWRL